MHAFLIFCVAVEAVGLVFLFRRVNIGFDAASRHRDAIIEQVPTLPEGLTETNWSELIGKVQEHTSALIEITELGEATDVALNLFIDAFQLRMSESEIKLSDLTEGCARLDSDLSTTSEDVRECVKLRQSDLNGLNKRITEIADAQEKARRKSGLHNSPGAFESLRATAETNARKHPDPAHAELVAFAEGPE